MPLKWRRSLSISFLVHQDWTTICICDLECTRVLFKWFTIYLYRYFTFNTYLKKTTVNINNMTYIYIFTSTCLACPNLSGVDKPTCSWAMWKDEYIPTTSRMPSQCDWLDLPFCEPIPKKQLILCCSSWKQTYAIS